MHFLFNTLTDRGCFVNTLDEPRGAVAFEEDALKQMVERAGLTLAQPILWERGRASARTRNADRIVWSS